MTTIVYDHERRQIACDSRACQDNIIKSDAFIKWRYVGANLYFLAGATCDFDEFIKMAESRKVPHDYTFNSIAFVVKNGKVYKAAWNSEDGLWEQPLENCDAIGSGGDFALAALDFGKSVKAAIKYAMTRDCHTGGKIHIYDIESAKFL